MTVALSAKEIIGQLDTKFPGIIEEAGANAVLVKAGSLLAVVEHLQTADGLKFDYYNFVTAVDYYSYFEVVCQLTSTKYNHSIVVKVRCYDRDNPTVPSLTGLYRGADFQEREVYDLMGINFEGHPNLKRIFLWEGFDGYPLRKDFNR